MENILHIARSFDVSGRSRLIHSICLGVNIAGYKSLILSLSDDCKYEQNDVEVVNIPVNGFERAMVGKIIQLVRDRHITVIHSHGRGGLVYAALSSLFMPKIKWVHTVHRSDGDIVSRYWFGRKLLTRRVNVLTAVSKNAAEAFSKVNGYSLNSIRVVYNGINLDLFNARKNVLQNKSMPVIGTVANLSADKDIATLLNAFAFVVKKYPAARLRIIGSGLLEGKLKALADKLYISNRVEFMGCCNDIPERLKELDVFVLSTKTEGFGISIVEAMASGVPVVASNIGGIPEIVKDGKNGLLFAVGDVEGLADKIMDIIKDDTIRRQLIDSAIGTVKRKFSHSIMISEYVNVYNE